MPRFGDIMSEDDVRAIQAFVIEKANEDQTLREEPGWWHTCKLALYEFLGWLFMLFIGGTSSSA